MINKQNLWFLTLFSLILVLSVYYITMPNDLLIGDKNNSVVTKSSKKKATVKETSSLVAMRVSLEEERQEQMVSLQEKLTNKKATTDEKNNAYEQLKYLNQLQGQEENLEKQIKEKLELDSFVKIDQKNIEVVAIKEKHDSSIANNIMRLVQSNYEEKMYITVTFKKS
ncbi:MAG: SpoIIIAH-like family protein [bacterium]|nr:SpoIIIAH-like family protein [bacterium]